MNRRQILSAIGASSAFGLAGCAVVSDAIELLSVSVTNMYEEERSVRVRVDHDGETVEESTYELGANEGTSLDCTWPEGPGNFVVAGRFEGGEAWIEQDFTDVDSDCAIVTVNVHMSGDLQLLTGSTCDPPGESC